MISSSARTPIFLALNGRRGGKARLEERERGIMMASLIQPTKLGRKEGMEEMKELDAFVPSFSQLSGLLFFFSDHVEVRQWKQHDEKSKLNPDRVFATF